ncbi:MAG: dihydropteroate synthase [Holosporales bacterium]|jgi:2-amino-4-hydroxy-6-hydroxymethyldihydropteridine diphosphokinase/dihydropteroate synthase|nr:dihydropteroate synthase [Holosporales bacterium]
MKRSVVHVSLGTNVGNRLDNLRMAVVKIGKRCLSNIKTSVVLETPAILLPGSPKSWDRPFLNMVIRGETQLTPYLLMDQLKQIEAELGRPIQHEKWSPRTIDLDILLWGDEIIETPNLTIPHKELLNRPFLLHLMALLDPKATHLGKDGHTTMADLADKCADLSSLFTHGFVLFPKLVGVVNITPDSFSDGGRHFKAEEAIDHAIRLVNQGAAVIELGPQSLRVGAELLDGCQEWARLEPVLAGIEDFQKQAQYRICVSIETPSPAIVQKVTKRGPIYWINDVIGKWDNHTLKSIAESGGKIVSMHSLDVPPKKEHTIKGDVVEHVNAWAGKTCKTLCSNGFTKDQIIFDPGIGFGKNCYQNLELLRNANALKQTGCEVMIGHSRKSYLSAITKLPPAERDLETIAVSSVLAESEADYLRVHNVADHQRFLTARALAIP